MISVIIPVYNAERYIEDALNSALNQSYSDIEYILVDDCGSDSSIDIINRIIADPKYSNKIRLIRQEKNKGPAAARNAGIKAAKGDYIFFMDSDDYITPNCLELHLRKIESTCADFSVGNTRLEGAKSLHIKSISSDIEKMSPTQAFLQRKWLNSAWNKLFRKQFLIRNNLFFDEGMSYEDIIWSFKLSLKSESIAVIPEQTYIYKINAESFTSSKVKDIKMTSLINQLKEMKKLYLENNRLQKFKVDFFKYFDFYRLNTAVLLFNFDGSRSSVKSYYKEIQNLSFKKDLSLISVILKMPFGLFCMFKPLYRIYKYRNSKQN